MGVNPHTQQVESPKRGQMPLTWGGRHVFTTRRGPTLIGVPYAGQFWSRKNERRVLMGVTFIRKPKQPSYEELEALGIIVEYRPYEALKPINRPHFKNGVGVRLIADDGPWRYICKKGDVGTVQAILPSLKGGTDDMYKVAMTPTGKPPVVAYLFFNELEGGLAVECASCGKRVGGVSVIVGIVRVTTHKCSCCGKVWRDKELTVPFSVPVLESEVSRLKATPGTKSPVVRVSIRFLTGKLEHHSLQGLDPEASLRRRRDANWERQFLKSMLGEDYL